MIGSLDAQLDEVDPPMQRRPHAPRAPRAAARGVTLIELMIVVVIITVLTSLAVTGYRKVIYQARNAEAYHFLGAIRASQNLYYQSTGQYAGGAGWAEWPQGAFPSANRVNWGEPDDPTWQALGARPEGPVWFKYQIRASENPAEAPADSFRPPPVGPWYQAQARGDFDADGVTSLFEITSAKAEVYVEDLNE